MLATFVIGLREGLEAALIVGIIAAFLTKNGRSLLPMWVGVVAGIVISAGVGVTLKVIESSLDQAAQEGMETVIGAVAVVFVTGMILWMTTHARFLKRDLEASARDALGDGTSRALVIMAFLAVLKEGFETSVFLLATFQASTNATLAATGAVLGVVVSAGVGYGLYSGGVRLNLARFFTGTSVFLVLVAAGLVVNAFRTAHEAGWLNAGQQHTLDLSWLAPRGSIQSAVLTGVLGIPADPRLLEVVAWLGYLVPMALILYWPATHRLSSRAGARLKLGIGALLVVGAAALALAVPAPRLTAQGPATLIDASGLVVGTAGLTADASAVTVTLGSNSISVPLSGGTPAQHDGIPATRVAQDVSADTSALPRSLTLAQLVTLGDGRLPVGISAQRNPGPFDVAWTRGGSREVWVAHGQLLDISQLDVVVLTLTGGGLPTSRTIGISSGTTLPDGSVSGAWSSDPAYGQATATSIQSLATREGEASFWRHTLPMGLLIAAVLLLLNGFRVLRRVPSPDPVPAPTSSPPTPTTEGASLDAASTPDRRSTADVR
ncbi:MAG: iron uptake transporter permease EfeU [Lapillicoccus sp.]